MSAGTPAQPPETPASERTPVEPTRTSKHVDCPSCRAQIPLDEHGDPRGSDVAHFSMRQTPVETSGTVPPTEATPEPQTPPSAPVSRSWGDRVNDLLAME